MATDKKKAEPGQAESSPPTGHEKHCFVVMPTGRSPEEKDHFRGWYQEVIEPAVTSAGYDSILSTDEEDAHDINDRIRTHVALDPMVVVDLGGPTVEHEPNPNVMYELGVRHAFNKPVVLMAWKGQDLPFDIGTQRVIMEPRQSVDFGRNRERITAVIQAAKEGEFYRPMDIVTITAELKAMTQSADLDISKAFQALTARLDSMSDQIGTGLQVATGNVPVAPDGPTLGETMGFQDPRRPNGLISTFLASGGTSPVWKSLLERPLSLDSFHLACAFSVETWSKFVTWCGASYHTPQGPYPGLDPIASWFKQTRAIAAIRARIAVTRTEKNPN